MPIDTSKINQKIPVPAGEVIFQEGAPANSLNILHEGSLIIEKKIKTGNLPLLSISGTNLTPGIISLFSSGRYPYSIKTAQNCVISTYAVNNSTIRKTISGKISLGVMVARTLLKEIAELYKKVNQILMVSSTMEKYSDNLAISYYVFSPSVFPDIDPSKPLSAPGPEIQDPILRLTRENLRNFFERGGRLPEPPTTGFLAEDHRDQLAKEYHDEEEFDDREFLFMRKILSVDPKVQAALFEADVTMLVNICEKFSQVYESIFTHLDEAIEKLNNDFDIYCGGALSLIEKYYLILDLLETGYGDSKPEVVIPITENISEKTQGFLASYKSIFGRDFAGISPNLQSFIEKSKKISMTLTPAQVSGKVETALEAGIDVAAIRKELENSASKIISFAGLPPDKVKEFSAQMIKLKQMKNPLDADPDARKIRRNITKTYWDIYQASFIKYIIAGKKAPKPVEMMLSYGYFDETLLENDQLAYLYTLNDNSKAREGISVPKGVEWLEKIYKKEVPNSLDELGQTYFDKIKLDYKDSGYKKESDVPANIDTAEARLKFEMNAFYESNARLTSGSQIGRASYRERV
ncbi:MAG: cyclic nucleotide-binding domain-containing protein, partial [Leptospira sp.]|nr:cyclic nucleotide-binding domain-containing protein [Leptospira sp.]